jgi:hypothetical protein
MDILQDGGSIHKKSFLGHVFSTTDDSKSEMLNVVQYATMGVVPIVILNKLVQRFIPEADSEKSSLELGIEIFLQLTVMFLGVIFIHRTISYMPTYSGYKYEDLSLTNVILMFLIIVLSIQTKLGIKAGILTDRVLELWNGPSEASAPRKRASMHTTSQADYFDNMGEGVGFPPAPVVSSKSSPPPQQEQDMGDFGGPIAANSALGGSFGSFF